MIQQVNGLTFRVEPEGIYVSEGLKDEEFNVQITKLLMPRDVFIAAFKQYVMQLSDDKK